MVTCSCRDPAAGAAGHRGEIRHDGKALCISKGTTETRQWALWHQNQQKCLGGSPVSTTNRRLLSSFFSAELQGRRCCFCKGLIPFQVLSLLPPNEVEVNKSDYCRTLMLSRTLCCDPWCANTFEWALDLPTWMLVAVQLCLLRADGFCSSYDQN